MLSLWPLVVNQSYILKICSFLHYHILSFIISNHLERLTPKQTGTTYLGQGITLMKWYYGLSPTFRG